jgi:hypothetical protein
VKICVVSFPPRPHIHRARLCPRHRRTIHRPHRRKILVAEVIVPGRDAHLDDAIGGRMRRMISD